MARNHVTKLPVPGIDRAWVFVSTTAKPDEYEGGTTIAEYLVSLVWLGERVAAEWEPKYGPISLFFKATPEDEATREHYTFDRIREPRGDWSQMAVDREFLPDALHAGNLERVFGVLRSWAHSHGEPGRPRADADEERAVPEMAVTDGPEEYAGADVVTWGGR